MIELKPSILKKRRRFVRFMLKMFGDGSDPDDIYRFGPFPELFGRLAQDLEIQGALDWHLEIEDAESYRAVRLDASVLPTFLRATVRPPSEIKPGQALAVSLNGVVVATTASFAVGGHRQGISAMLPPSTFRRGDNNLEVFEVVRGSRDLGLRKILGD